MEAQVQAKKGLWEALFPGKAERALGTAVTAIVAALALPGFWCLWSIFGAPEGAVDVLACVSCGVVGLIGYIALPKPEGRPLSAPKTALLALACAACAALYVLYCAHFGAELGTPDTLADVLYSCVCAPLCEELFWRGLVWTLIWRLAGPEWATWLSAVGFAVGHGGVAHVLVAFAFGCFQARLREATGSLRAPIACHLSWNLSCHVVGMFLLGAL